MTGEGLDDFDEAAEAEWQRLRAQIELAEGFWLGFVFTDAPRRAATLRGRVDGLLRSRGADLWWASPAGADELREYPARILALRWPQSQARCIWIEALDAESRWLEAWAWLAARLNEHRESLRRHVRAGLVLVAPSAAKPIFREECPDLWSIRDLVVEFSGGGHPTLPLPDLEVGTGNDGDLELAKQALAALPRGAPSALRAEYHLRVADSLLTSFRSREAIDAAMAALVLLRGQPERERSRILEVKALRVLGGAEWADGDTGAARAHLREMTALVREIRRAPQSLAEAGALAGAAVFGLVILAEIEARLGDLDTARALRGEAIELAEEVEPESLARLELLRHALTPLPADEGENALRLREEMLRALAIADVLHDASPNEVPRALDLGTTLLWCAVAERRLGDLPAARAHLLRGQRLLHDFLERGEAPLRLRERLATIELALYFTELAAGFASASAHRDAGVALIEGFLDEVPPRSRPRWEQAMRDVLSAPQRSSGGSDPTPRPRRRRRPPA